MSMHFDIRERKGHVTCKMCTGADEVVCTCEISISRDAWNITAWYTKEGFKNKGLGKQTMQVALRYCRETYGEPQAMQYTWNGVNHYVLEWLEKNFDAVCTCPIAVQKNQSGDDWDSHIYGLDKEKVLQYFGL